MAVAPKVSSVARDPRRCRRAALCVGAIVVLTLMFTAAAPAVAATPDFSDVPATHPYYAAITDLASRDIITSL